MTSSNSSTSVSLSPKEFADSVLSRHRAVAVFDCDGTLWEGDSGYDFMVWSIEEGIVSRSASDWIDSRYLSLIHIYGRACNRTWMPRARFR